MMAHSFYNRSDKEKFPILKVMITFHNNYICFVNNSDNAPNAKFYIRKKYTNESLGSRVDPKKMHNAWIVWIQWIG